MRGYGILQPRVTASLTTGDEASFFQRIFSANRGLDPYVFAVSDLYQDVFDDGTFTGKGMYHIDAVEAALRGRIAENEVLSHDLLEGALARSALVTDVELVEDYPTRYDVDASRQHRWARGDWQLLPYIFGRRRGDAVAVALEDDRQSAAHADADLLGDRLDCRLDAAALRRSPRSCRRCSS